MKDLETSRIIVRNLDSDLGIIIPGRRQYFVLAFMLIWICGWSMGGISTIFAPFNPSISIFARLYSLLLLGAWALGWYFAAGIILWQLIGKEVIIVTSGVLTIYKKIGFEFGRKIYFVSNVKNMEQIPQPENSSFRNHTANAPIIGTPAVSFEYGNQSIIFGKELNNAEAEMLLAAMRKKIPSAFSA